MQQTGIKKPRGLMVAGLSGGSGKSVVAIGLAAAYVRQGFSVVPFKKGPDYIDAGWLQVAAANPCYNLDPYLMPAAELRNSFLNHCRHGNLALVEGNRGLYDGVDVQGSFSSAELAISLELPVLLVVNCTKTTRTVAALILGCLHFEPRLAIRGVVLNQLGSVRHEQLVRRAVEEYTGVPVLGALPRFRRDLLPQRHLGITPCPEHGDAAEAVEVLAAEAAKHLDLDAIAAIMAEVPASAVVSPGNASSATTPVARIGILKDAAFQFYYPENLEALVKAGAELVEINALSEPQLPEIDGLYIGGGFPETSVRALAANHTFRASIKQRAQQGLPIYAECGGLIYLGERMLLEEKNYPLVGIFPVSFGLGKKPQAHGYTVLRAAASNPYYDANEEIRGHEFRYSRILEWRGEAGELAFVMQRGVGFAAGRDGLVYKNVLALYTHIHALGTPGWAPALVRRARTYREAGRR